MVPGLVRARIGPGRAGPVVQGGWAGVSEASAPLPAPAGEPPAHRGRQPAAPQTPQCSLSLGLAQRRRRGQGRKCIRGCGLKSLSPSCKMLAPETHGTLDASSGGQAREFLKGQRGRGALAGGSPRCAPRGVLRPAPPLPASSAAIAIVRFFSGLSSNSQCALQPSHLCC